MTKAVAELILESEARILAKVDDIVSELHAEIKHEVGALAQQTSAMFQMTWAAISGLENRQLSVEKRMESLEKRLESMENQFTAFMMMYERDRGIILDIHQMVKEHSITLKRHDGIFARHSLN